MFNGGGDDVLAPFAQLFHGTEKCPVVGFRAAGGEEHPVRFGAHGGSYLMPGSAQAPGGF